VVVWRPMADAPGGSEIVSTDNVIEPRECKMHGRSAISPRYLRIMGHCLEQIAGMSIVY
jgi:hypothetical protein